MKKTLLFAALCFVIPFCAKAQFGWETPVDSFTIIYKDSIVLNNIMPLHYSPIDSMVYDTTKIIIDTTGAGVWQIGNTNKPVFSPNDTTYTLGIMTDTTGFYPTNVNNYFTIKIHQTPPNMIVKIWHKYQTDSALDGGIVEVSADSGTSWLNVVPCPFSGSAVSTYNFYGYYDTIASGDNAFTGNSHGEILSEFQLFNCEGLRTMSSPCTGYSYFTFSETNYIRFRFVSSSVHDTLSGWMIDSIQIVNPACEPGKVSNITPQKAPDIFPSPAFDELTIKTSSTQPYTLTLLNMLGQVVYSITTNNQQETIDVSRLPAGVYEVHVKDENNYRYYNTVSIIH